MCVCVCGGGGGGRGGEGVVRCRKCYNMYCFLLCTFKIILLSVQNHQFIFPDVDISSIQTEKVPQKCIECIECFCYGEKNL